jgi:hypothetical protein
LDKFKKCTFFLALFEIQNAPYKIKVQKKAALLTTPRIFDSHTIAKMSLSTLCLLKKRRIRNRNIAVFTTLSAVSAGAYYYRVNFDKVVQHNSKLKGAQWIKELLTGHPTRMKNNLEVWKEAFLYLESLLRRRSNLQSTKYMGTAEQLGYAVATELSIRKPAERFQRSTETVDRVYHKVMRSILSKEIIERNLQHATEFTPLHNHIKDNPIWFPFFKDCLGAIDGTHIAVSPPEKEKAAYWNRRGFLSQNVLAVCNFDMCFTDVMVRWEGSPADSTLCIEGLKSGAVHIPEGKYVLGDAGFPNCDKCLTPYWGVRYHLQEWTKGNRRPQNKELYNLRHAKLRNVIERIFGVAKSRWKILKLPRTFKMKAQIRVVMALYILYNILVKIQQKTDPGELEDDWEIFEEEEGMYWQ